METTPQEAPDSGYAAPRIPLTHYSTSAAMKNTNQLFACGALFVALGAGMQLTTGTANATDSGLGFYPTADIYPNQNFHFDYDSFGNGLDADIANSVGIEYGFGSDSDKIFGRNEIGFDYVLPPGTGRASDRLALNFKTQLYANSGKNERIAIGVGGLGGKANFKSYNARLLGYKGFSFGRVHAGLFKDFKTSTGGSETGGIQLGFDRAITKNVIVGIDYRSGPSGFAAPCIIYNINDKAGFELAVGRANNSGISPRTQVYLAFDYNFDFKKAGPTVPNSANLETPGAQGQNPTAGP